MAYEYFFSLTCSELEPEIRKELIQIAEKDVFREWQSVTWGHMIDDCLRISKDFPNVLIKIELQDDNARVFENPFRNFYFKNGKYHQQTSKIVWDEFNEEMLKNP